MNNKKLNNLKEERGEIDVEAVLRLVNRATEQMRAKARVHFRIALPLYLLLIVVIIITLSLSLGGWFGLGFFMIWFIVTLAKIPFSVEANHLRFIMSFGLVRRAISHGLHARFWPLEKPYWIEIDLADREIGVTETVELIRTTVAPRNYRIIKVKVILRVTNPYIYTFVMAGETTEDKKELIGARFKDRIQSYINLNKLPEDKVDSLSGREVYDDLTEAKARKGGPELEEEEKERYKLSYEDWGMVLRSIEIKGIEVSEETKKQRVKEYEEMMKALGFQREVDQIAIAKYGKKTGELKNKQRMDVYTSLLHKKSIEALRSTDKTILGGPQKILEEIVPEVIAEGHVRGSRK